MRLTAICIAGSETKEVIKYLPCNSVEEIRGTSTAVQLLYDIYSTLNWARGGLCEGKGGGGEMNRTDRGTPQVGNAHIFV